MRRKSEKRLEWKKRVEVTLSSIGRFISAYVVGWRGRLALGGAI
jgi:hypothetical protein